MRDLARPRRNVRFPDGLQRVYALCVLLPDLHHLSKRALPNHLEQVELLDCKRLVLHRLEVDLEMERARTSSRGVPLI